MPCFFAVDLLTILTRALVIGSLTVPLVCLASGPASAVAGATASPLSPSDCHGPVVPAAGRPAEVALGFFAAAADGVETVKSPEVGSAAALTAAVRDDAGAGVAAVAVALWPGTGLPRSTAGSVAAGSVVAVAGRAVSREVTTTRLAATAVVRTARFQPCLAPDAFTVFPLVVFRDGRYEP